MLRNLDPILNKANYKSYQPNYPLEIVKTTLGDLKEKKLDFLLDVGCGGGQSVNIFAPYFHEVLAIDPSENQIKEARSQNKFAHVTYKQGFAEKLPCDDVSVDVIVAASSAPWFDRPKFYKEVDRVLKPEGRLIMFGYWMPSLVPIGVSGDVTELAKVGFSLFEDAILRGANGDLAEEGMNRICKRRYVDIFDEIMYLRKQQFDNVLTECVWSLDDAKEYVLAYITYNNYLKGKELEQRELSEEERNARLLELDYSEQFVRSLKESWGCTEMENSDVKMKVIFNFYGIIAEK
ncbi:uncharacterized protein LOC101242873 [Ciona intestinalis]